MLSLASASLSLTTAPVAPRASVTMKAKAKAFGKADLEALADAQQIPVRSLPIRSGGMQPSCNACMRRHDRTLQLRMR